jgi:exopolysaccharide production protein ExoQ
MDNATHSGFPEANLPTVRLAPRTSVGGITQAAVDKGVSASFSEQCFAVCVLVLSTTAFVNLFPGEQGLEYVEQGLLFSQIIWSILYILMLFFVRKKIIEFVRLMWQNKFLVLLMGWACLSGLWSIDRGVTIRHLIALLLTSLFGIYLAVRYDLREQLRVVSIALGIVIVASIGACLAFPSYGIRSEESSTGPAWQGVLSHKNTLARLAVLAALILALYFMKRVRRATVLIAIVLLFFLVILTQSKTSLVYFIMAMLAFPLVRAFQKNPAKRRKIIAFALLIVSGLATWTYYNWESFTYSLGKDPELTGRVALWGLSMTWIAEKPFLGYGFDAFWSNYYGPAADFRVASGWLVAPHAHNGFINLWLDLGLIGVLLFVFGFVISYRKAVGLAKTTKIVEGIWPITFLTFLFVYSLTEIDFMVRNSLFWILYVSMVFGLRSNFIQRLRLETVADSQADELPDAAIHGPR